MRAIRVYASMARDADAVFARTIAFVRARGYRRAVVRLYAMRLRHHARLLIGFPGFVLSWYLRWRA